MGGTLQRQGAGPVSRFKLTDWKFSTARFSIYPGGAACLDSLPEEFTVTTTSLGERVEHKLFFRKTSVFGAGDRQDVDESKLQ